MSLIEDPLQDFIPPREIPRRRLIHSGIAQQKFRRAVLEASAEIAAEFTEHYWKEVVNGGKSGGGGQVTSGQGQEPPPPPPPLPPPTSNQSLKQRFIFYLNASGRYLVLREHLRQAVSHIVQQRCLNLRPTGFQSHRDFQTLLHDMYNYLVDEMHESLNRTKLLEGDPLDPPLAKVICDPEAEPPTSMKEFGTKTLLRELLFYSEESFVQGDFDNCHRIHLQRICRSREDSSCWLDFALMWLSRGDDRMAEISVREALRRDPTSIYALVIGGIIAVRHNDSRGVAVLGAALDMKPLSPELLVIIALANFSIGALEDSDYFFRKAAHLHRTLTGQPLDDLDEILAKLARPSALNQSLAHLSQMEGERNANQQQAAEEMAEMEEEEEQPIEISTKGSGKKGNKKNANKSLKKSRKSKTGADADPATEEIFVKKSSKSDDLRNNNPKPMDGAGDAGQIRRGSKKLSSDVPEEEEEEAIEEEFHARKGSLSKGDEDKLDPSEAAPRPKIDYIPAIADLIVEDSILPPLRPSLLVPWDITDISDNFKTVPNKNQEASDPQKVDSSSDIASNNVIQAEYDQLINEEEEDDEAEQETPPKKESLPKRKSSEPKTVEGDPAEVTPTPQDKARTSLKNDPEANNNDPEMEELFLSGEAMQAAKLKGGGQSGDVPPIFINRGGSELIWAGQLLLKLRMFDMLDGVLSRELYMTGKRSMEYLYLRAMSLYIRKCQKEAIPVIDEAIALDPVNPTLWILRGHCFYEIGEPDEAANNYEAALRIPVGKENRHLLYLRFGSLALDAGNYDTAKRVFLYGIQKYPTPYLWLAIGNTCYTMGNLEEAESAFAEANRLDNTNPITWAHLALINLATDRQALAEQSYKWAMRFGLKKGKILDEIKKLQIEKGFGDPSFPRIPNCIPHDYYVRRLGRQKPFDIYRDALMHEIPTLGKKRFDNTERENALRDKLQQKTPSSELLEKNSGESLEEEDEEMEEDDEEEDPTIPREPPATDLETPAPGDTAEESESVKTNAPQKEKGRKSKSTNKREKRGDAKARAQEDVNVNKNRPSNPVEGQRRRTPQFPEKSGGNPATKARDILKDRRASYY